LLFAATATHAGQKTRTKSNNSNDRVAPEGVVLQDSAAGANGCFAGTGPWSWAAVSSVGALAGGAGGGAAAASYARTGQAGADLGPVCDSAQSAIDRINADAARLGALDAAVEAGDEAGIRNVLIEAGLSSQLAAGAQFHAINTKGTGATNGRVSASQNSASDEMPQVAHVARIVAREQQLQHRRIELRRLARFQRLCEEVTRERGNVGAALTQRRQRAAPCGNAIVEIAAEVSGAHLLVEIAMRRGDEAKARLLPRVASDAFVRPLLHHA
jgi:hypothetical protein